MNAVLVLLLCVCTASCFTLKFDEYEQQWNAWKSFHGKKYATGTEEAARYAIWKNNLKKIQTHNAEGHSYTLAMNQFGDEYYFFYLGFRSHYSNKTSDGSAFLPPSEVTLPTTVDWRTKGYVTGVVNEGQCGCSWGISAIGSLVGQHFKKTGDLVPLSLQNLIDCTRSYGNQGCRQGTMDNAFRYIAANDGIDSSECYPYEDRDDLPCRFKRSCVVANCTGLKDIPTGNETALQVAVATIGPISVGIDASHSSFQFYHDGVYNEPSCSSTLLDHDVLIVGYGTYQHQDYWLVKNSWGTRWGKEGYIMMSRNKNNQCGIATKASYPLV